MVLVSSSTNNGTPSVRARICSRISAGNALPPADRSTRVMPSRRPRRASASVVTCASAGQGGVNSGRAVTRSSNGSVGARATVRVNSSSEVGSIQCASSNSISTGCSRRQPRQLRQQRLERPLLAPLRREVRETVFVAGRDRHPLGDEPDLLGAGVRPGEQRFELGQPRFRHVLAAEARGVLELGDEGMERARLMVRRAEIAQPRVRLARRAAAASPAPDAICRCRVRRSAPPPGPRRPWPAASGAAIAPALRRGRRAGSARAARNASKRLSAALPRTTRAAITGAPKPLSSTAPRSTYSNRPPVSRRVLGAITTAPGSASACSRAARFGVSPTTACSCASPEPTRSPTTTRPVAMPTRTCNGAAATVSSPATFSTSFSAARTARSASCSSARG